MPRVMTRQATAAIAAILVLIGAGCGGSSSSESGSTEQEITVPLEEESGSAESGTATLTVVGDQTKVVLDVQSRSATPVASKQPAHIHKGSCEELDPTPAYGLSDVTAGTSTSTVNVKLDELLNDAFVINVHESAENVERYVACGVISAGSGDGDDPLGHDKESDY
jgi:hypothetical protein